MLKIYSKTQNGRIFKCPTCNDIHFEYKNLNFNFKTIEDCKFTAKYFLKLDGEFWETKNEDSPFKKKIFIPIGHKNFHILLNNEELDELKQLFSNSFSKNRSIFEQIDLNINYSNN